MFFIEILLPNITIILILYLLNKKTNFKSYFLKFVGSKIIYRIIIVSIYLILVLIFSNILKSIHIACKMAVLGSIALYLAHISDEN